LSSSEFYKLGGEKLYKFLKTTGHISVFLVLFILFLTIQYTIVAAEDDYAIIVIGSGSGKVGPIFKSDKINGQGLWYPGYSESNTLRVRNNLGEKTTVTKIGMSIALERDGVKLSLDHSDAQSYLSSMKIKVEYKSILDKTFKSKIFDGTFKEFAKGIKCNISVGKNKDMDMKYTVSMDKGIGNEAQGIKAIVDFTINVESESIEQVDPEEPDDKPVFDEDDSEPTDIEVHWAHDCILTLIKHGIIEGYPDRTIRPDSYVTRAETAVLVGRALKLIEEEGKTGYRDNVPDWARGYIKATTIHNIFTGYTNNAFKASRNISRQEMTAVLMRAFCKTLDKDEKLDFLDENEIGDWALEYVKIGVQQNVIEGYPDNTFKAQDSITRAEAFTMICKLLGYHVEHKIENKR